MKQGQEIGKMSFDFDENQIGEIAAAGKLNAFVEKASELFRQNLKAELVNRASSGSFSLAHFSNFEGFDFGTVPPIGPWPHLIKEIEVLKTINKEVVLNNPVSR